MTAFSWLMIGNMAVWIGVAGYVLFVWRAQNALDARLSRLERCRDGR